MLEQVWAWAVTGAKAKASALNTSARMIIFIENPPVCTIPIGSNWGNATVWPILLQAGDMLRFQASVYDQSLSQLEASRSKYAANSS
jgi:hypothetical protein